MSNEAEFLKFSCEKLTQLMGRIETCVAKLTPAQIWTRAADNENAVGNLVLHLAGNVRQWILCGVGGAEDRRDRDSEFDARSGEDVLSRLRLTVEEAVALIAALPHEKLGERRTIQKHYDVTVLEAIYHVVEHFSMHTGQIIFATKLLTGEDLGFYGYLKSGRARAETPMDKSKSKQVQPQSILRPAPTAAVPANRIGRQSLGLYPHVSRKLLALAVDSAAETVVRVLNGSVDPTLALAGRMAKELGMTVEDLMGDLAGERRKRGVKGGRLQRQKAGP